MSQNLISSRSVAVALASVKAKDPFESEGRLSDTDRVRCWPAVETWQSFIDEKWRQIEARQNNSLGSASKPIGNRGEPYAC